MAQQVRLPAANSDDLSLMLRTHKMGGKRLLKVL